MNGLLIIILFLLRIKISCEKIENYIYLYILDAMSEKRELSKEELHFVAMMGALFANSREFVCCKNHSTLRGLYISQSGIFTASLNQPMERLVEIMRDRKYLSSDAQEKALAVLPDLQRIRLQILLIQHPAFIRVEHSKTGQPIGSMSSGILAQLDDVIGVAKKSLST